MTVNVVQHDVRLLACDIPKLLIEITLKNVILKKSFRIESLGVKNKVSENRKESNIPEQYIAP